MRRLAILLAGVSLVTIAGCARRVNADATAAAYGYSDTVATVGGPPPTQPPDPAGLGTLVPTSVAASTTQNLSTIPPTGNPTCVLVAEPGDTIDSVVNRLEGVDAVALRSENGLTDDAEPEVGEHLDICVGNEIFDIYGTSRVAPSGPYAKQLQEALNNLFAGTSMLPLAVDGDAGKLTQQATCAARAVTGLPVSTGYPIKGSTESETLLNATQLSVPAGAPTNADRWLVIDKTCQVMFAGEKNTLVDVYPTSTGAPGYATTNGDFDGYRFDPALAGDGWHDSTAYPSDVDSGDAGNMYKPLYFNEGEAIHGARYIPPEPRSKGCARTFPEHQDKIVAWLGLDVLDDITWKESVIDLEVVVRGRYLTPTGEALPEPDVIIPPAYDQPATTVESDG